MFDRDIISSDSFTEMTSDAQSLYFHLGVNADDEGFVSPRGIMRMISAPEDALRILVVKNFVIPFKSGVVVITNWHQNNYLDKHKIKETQHQEEKSQLYLTPNREYGFNQGLTTSKNDIDNILTDKSSHGFHHGSTMVPTEEKRREESSINNILLRKSETNVSLGQQKEKKQPESDGAKINYLIGLFSKVNPMYADFFGRKVERKAMESVLKALGFDETEKILLVLPQIISKPYAPKVTKPTEMQRDLGKLAAFISQERSVKNKKNNIVKL